MQGLDHVRWLGGGSGAGKSTVARALAQRHDLVVLSTDDTIADHAARLGPAVAPLLHRFLDSTLDERWVRRTPEEMLETFPWFAGEGFELVVEDLRAAPADRLVVVEGFRLLPHLVRPLLTDPAAALWLLPTPRFRWRAFTARGSTATIAGRTSDPPQALANLLARDALFTERLAHGLSAQESLVVDGSLPQEALVEAVARRWRLP